MTLKRTKTMRVPTVSKPPEHQYNLKVCNCGPCNTDLSFNAAIASTNLYMMIMRKNNVFINKLNCKFVWIYLWWFALCPGHQRRNTWVSSVVWDDCIRYMRYQGKEHLRQKCRLAWGRKGDEWQITSGDRLADLSAAGQHCMKDNRQWTHSW